MDREYMRMALELAVKGEGAVNPNPMVGAVVVKNGKVIGKGYHRYFGGPHAEVYAIEEAGLEANGAEIYVTLEPCSHFGKTPPCADKIIVAGIKKCYIAMKDPNPLVAGRGVKRMQEAGIEVVSGIMEEEAVKLNHVFLKYITTGEPYVYLKCAITIDGKIATRNGSSKWITGEQAREEVHRIRNRYMGVIVGKNTVLHDDPELNVRVEVDNLRNPFRIIVDPELDVPKNARVIKAAEDGKTIIIAKKEMAETMKGYLFKEKGVKIVDGGEYPFNMREVLRKLGRMGIDSVLVEGGRGIISSFFSEKLIDGGTIFIAPKILGDEHGKSFIGGFERKSISESFELRDIEIKSYGKDIAYRFSGVEWKDGE